MTHKKSVPPFVSKSEAGRRSGIRRATIYDLIDVGIIAVDDKGKILRSPFEVWLANRTGTIDEN